MSILQWIDGHASAIQALAALATLVVTAVLARLTARYVRLTNKIATAAGEQVSHMKDTTAAQRRQAAAALEALSRRLSVPLLQLAGHQANQRVLSEYSQLNSQDITALEGLAQQVSPDASQLSGKAAVSLKRIDTLIQSAKNVNPTYGWVPTATQSAEFADALDTGPSMLLALGEECRRVAAT